MKGGEFSFHCKQLRDTEYVVFPSWKTPGFNEMHGSMYTPKSIPAAFAFVSVVSDATPEHVISPSVLRWCSSK